MTRHPDSVQVWDEIVFTTVENAMEMGNAKAAMGTLESFQKRLSTTGRVRAQAQIAVLNLDADRRSKAQQYSRLAVKAYRPKMGNQDPVLRGLMAEIAYRGVQGSSGRYFKIRLTKKIDNKVVERKSKLLDQLETGYQKVMEYKSPAWALKACFRSNELYSEFAEFLLNSPVPKDLNPEQKIQYRTLIQQKAQAYSDKARQYLKTCLELARKWEICDPLLTGYFHPAENPQGRGSVLKSMSGRKTSSEVNVQALQDPSFSQLYSQLLAKPDDIEMQLTLAKAYLKQGDFRQAALVAQNALPKVGGDQRVLKAELLNLVGVTHLYCGKDPLAKETFKQALEANDQMAAARVNLAGIYRHYGHGEKAADMMRNTSLTNLDQDSIHPRVGAIYNELVMYAQ